jgi:DNA mismatch repair protein MSH3
LFVPETTVVTVQRKASTQSKRSIERDETDAENQEPSPKRARQSVGGEEEEGEDDFPVRRASAVSKPKATMTTKLPSVRTSKYVYSSSPVVQSNGHAEDEDEPESEESKKRKEMLHKRFVQKLGRPDAIAEIKRRNHFITEETEGGDGEGEGAEEEEEEPAPKKGGKAKPKGGARANGKLTPMEMQYLDIKKKHLDTIIVYEVGYKFRFFGEDARIASKELGIVCIPGKFRYDNHPSEANYDKFASASFPVARLHVHVKRLVQAGHKVGVVRQLETAALKAAGDNRNAPFVRKLTNVYTKGTYVDDLEGLDGPVAAPAGAVSTGYLLCLTESNARGYGNDEKVHVGIIAVQPATGSIIYDDFEDGFMRSEIETRLLHIAPCEYLIVGELSGATEKLIKHLSGSKSNVFGDQARVERVEKEKTMAAQAYSHVSNFYAGKLSASSQDEASEQSSHVLDKVHQLSEHVTVCLSAMIKHLVEYGLEHIFDLTKNFQSFSARTHMLLNGNTLSSLEIYKNQSDFTEKGSLFWTLDRTRTRFGKRLLRNWVGRPLLDQAKLEDRIKAVGELLEGGSTARVDRVKHMLSNVKSDLEKILTRVYYKKASRPELVGFLQMLQHVANEFSHVKSAEDVGFESTTLNEAIAQLPSIGDDIVGFLNRINLQAAKDDDKYSFFRDEHETEKITDHKMGIAAVEHELNEFRPKAASILGRKKVEYVTVAGIEYLIEVETAAASIKKVPASWVKISGTKKNARFHTPEVIKMIRERDLHKESLAAACDQAFADLLGEISGLYQPLRDCIQAMAHLDCLLSLADVAAQPGYCKPTFTAEAKIHVEQGRHPMVEQLLLDTYVPNNIALSSRPSPTQASPSTEASFDPSALLITGPNMGGKSSFVRSIALISIMGQIGSYVPAHSAQLGMLDAVFTRMGAFDNMMRGESTFMVELSETSDILKQATPRSLVILDELGRGTSTHDGVAIAEAVLRELVGRGVMTLFITHYQDLARVAASCDSRLKNVHVKFQESEAGSGREGEEDITFLYEVGEGVAHRSYGLNVARLAGLPRGVIEVARERSGELEESVGRRKVGNV